MKETAIAVWEFDIFSKDNIRIQVLRRDKQSAFLGGAHRGRLKMVLHGK
jgi:hypothetical protein